MTKILAHSRNLQAILSLVITISLCPMALSADNQQFDLVIANGRVIDPESGLDAIRHVGVIGSSIAEISTSSLDAQLARNGQRIDASALVVSPGFIDMHSHGHSQTSSYYQAHDGVTTSLELEGGVYAVREWLGSREGKRPINYGASISQDQARVFALLDDSQEKTELESALRESNNNAAFMDPAYAEYFNEGNYLELSPPQYLAMNQELAKGLAQGAIGVGLSHGYTPGTTEREIYDVFKFVAEQDSMIFTHVRAPNPLSIQEVINNSVLTGAALHIVHINSMSLGEIDFVLEMIATARQRGYDVSTELYPYTAASTGLGSALFDDGWQDTMGVDYEDLQWVETGERLNAETFRSYREIGGTVIIHMMEEEWIETALKEPFVIVASDGMPYSPGAHPRSAGTFSRVLGRYVRERETLDLALALRKMTLMPANRLTAVAPSMANKGRLQVGADADITIFDAKRIIDKATFEQGLAFSEGIEHVIVGGQSVIKDGETVEGIFPGKPVYGVGRE